MANEIICAPGSVVSTKVKDLLTFLNKPQDSIDFRYVYSHLDTSILGQCGPFLL